jgi:hypothetical protein
MAVQFEYNDLRTALPLAPAPVPKSADLSWLETSASQTPTFWPLTVLTADDVDLLSASIQSTGLRLDAIRLRRRRLSVLR